MSAKSFFDSNVLVYSLDRAPTVKGMVARNLLEQTSPSGVISYQIIQEVINVAFRKFDPPMKPSDAFEYASRLTKEFEIVPWSREILFRALGLKEHRKFSWYDCLMVAAALEARCEVLYSEDLQHGQVIEGLRVVNPFL